MDLLGGFSGFAHGVHLGILGVCWESAWGLRGDLPWVLCGVGLRSAGGLLRVCYRLAGVCFGLAWELLRVLPGGHARGFYLVFSFGVCLGFAFIFGFACGLLEVCAGFV